MIPTAQPVAIDLSRKTLQASDSTENTVSTTEPDGSFAALLQTPPSGDAGLALPVTGSELPVAEDTVPVPESITDFVAYYEGDDDVLVTTNDGGVLPNVVAEPAEHAAIPGLTGMAPPALAEIDADSSRRRDLRGGGRLGLHTLDGLGFSRRDHGRMPFAQPMNPPERMIFKTGGQGGEVALSSESVAEVRSGAAAAGDTAPTIPYRRGLGPGMPGVVPIDQRNRAIGEPAGGFELPVLRDGAEPAARPSAAVQASAVVSQLAELPQVRDLASATKPTPVFATTIGQPVLDDAWGEAFQDRVLWMAKGRIQNAEIRLNPAELGPIRVQVSVEDDAAMLNFTAQHNVTREAIEQALPRLREMLSENGLTLAGSTVTDSNERQAEDDRATPGAEDAAVAEAGALESEDSGSAVAQRINSDSLVDTFA